MVYNQLTPGRAVVIQNHLGEEIRELEGIGFSSPVSAVKRFPTTILNDNGPQFNFYDASSSPKLERFDL